MSEENSQNFSRLDFNEQLYVFYLELKGEITKKNIEIEKSQLQEIANSTNPSIILNYIRELFYMLINIQLKPEKENSKKLFKELNNEEYFQLESHIHKLESDIKILLKREFQNKITIDTLENKLNTYVDIEKEYEELKEKLKYEGGRFLENERKDNEIIILRQENSLLKKEIQKYEENNGLYKLKIKLEQDCNTELKKQISSLNKKLAKIEKENIKQSNNNNSSINININNNGNSSSKLVINHENNNNSNNNNRIIRNTSNFALRKTKVNKLIKNYRKNNFNNNIEKIAESDLRTKKHKSHSRYANNVDNISKAFTPTFTKILNSLYFKIKSPNRREKKFLKKNFSTIYIDDYEKTTIKNMNKSTRVKSKIKTKTNSDNRYSQNPKFPLSSKNRTNNYYSSLIPKTNLLREKSYGTFTSIVNNKK